MPHVFNPLLKTRYQSALCLTVVLALLALLACFGPQQLPVVIYKLALPLLGGFAGSFAWLTILPYANPSRYLAEDWRKNPDADKDGQPDFSIAEGFEAVFCVCVVCLTLAVCSGMLAVAWGL